MSRNFMGALPFSVGYDNFMGAGRPRRGAAHGGYHGGGRGGGGYGSSMSHAAAQRANSTAGFVRPDIAGTPARDAALLPAGFPVFAFALATGTNPINQTVNPQVPFRGQRLTSVTIRSGASAATSAPLLTIFQVGQKPIIVTSSGVPIEVFSQASFDTNLLMPPTVPGVIYSAFLQLSAALTTTDTITVLLAIIGSAVL